MTFRDRLRRLFCRHLWMGTQDQRISEAVVNVCQRCGKRKLVWP